MIKFSNLKDFGERVNAFGVNTLEQVRLGVEASLTEGEHTAKSNAPWTDRTGNARNSIIASPAEIKGNEIKGTLAIGVFYGVFLELCNGGKYRIIFPTLEGQAVRLPTWIRAMTKL